MLAASAAFLGCSGENLNSPQPWRSNLRPPFSKERPCDTTLLLVCFPSYSEFRHSSYTRWSTHLPSRNFTLPNTKRGDTSVLGSLCAVQVSVLAMGTASHSNLRAWDRVGRMVDFLIPEYARNTPFRLADTYTGLILEQSEIVSPLKVRRLSCQARRCRTGS